MCFQFKFLTFHNTHETHETHECQQNLKIWNVEILSILDLKVSARTDTIKDLSKPSSNSSDMLISVVRSLMPQIPP